MRRGKAMPQERAAPATTERYLGGGVIAQHTECLRVIDHQPSTRITGHARESRKGSGAPAGGTETIGHDDGPQVSAGRLPHPPLEGGRIMMRIALDAHPLQLGDLHALSVRWGRMPRRPE